MPSIDHAAYPGSSSISIIFSNDFQKVIVGHSNDDGIIKFPCGKREARDCDGAETIEMAARCCALRELAAETDPSVVSELDFFSKLAFERRFEKKLPDGSRLPLVQYHFVGMVKRHIDFWSLPIENREMGIPEWWALFDVLRLDRVGETRINPHHGGIESVKVNPYHQISLIRALRELRTMLGSNASAMDHVFANLIRIPVRDDLACAIGLKRSFTDSYDYEGVVRSLMNSKPRLL